MLLYTSLCNMFGRTDFAFIFSSALVRSLRIFCRHESYRRSSRGILVIKILMGLVDLPGVKADFPARAFDFEVVGVCGSRRPLEGKVERRVEIL